MLICLGGFLGSGRKLLARIIAEKYGLHYYDIDAHKMHRLIVSTGGRGVRDVPVQPTTDEYRMQIYRNVLADFSRLAKMYPDIVVDDAFHRRLPRETFLKEARKYFGSVVFVWIDSDESHVMERLTVLRARRIIRSEKKALARREKAAQEFEPLKPDTRVFKCVLGDQAEGEALMSLVRAELRRAE